VPKGKGLIKEVDFEAKAVYVAENTLVERWLSA
jgi:hypothetical protein